MNEIKYAPPFICLPPNREAFPNGPTNYVYAYDREYAYYSTNLYGYYCYILVPIAAPLRRKKSSPPPTPGTRVCTGSITFIADNFCDLIPESFEVDFQLNPFGGLFTSTISGCDGLPHERASFLCSDSTATIRTKLLAALQPEFVGKVDFTVTRSTIGTGFNSFVSDILVLPDGKMVIGGGFTSYNGIDSNRIIILNPDYSVFATAEGGAAGGFNNAVLALALAPDGSGDIIVGGNFTDYNNSNPTAIGIIRLNSDLTVDTVPTLGFNTPIVNAFAFLPNGDIVVGGGFTSYDGISSERIIILDSATLGIVQTAEGTGFDTTVDSLAVLNGTTIIAGGNFNSYNGVTSRHIIGLDSTLASATAITPDGIGFNARILDLEINSSGQIIAGGLFSTYNGNPRGKIIILDVNFATSEFEEAVIPPIAGSGFGTGNVHSLALQPNGDIIVGGFFSSYAGTSSGGIIILDGDDLSVVTAVPAPGTGFGPFQTVEAVALNNGQIVAGGSFNNYTFGTTTVLANNIIELNPDLTASVASNDTYTINVTFTDSASNPAPTSLTGTVLESCVVIEQDTDMNLVCVIT